MNWKKISDWVLRNFLLVLIATIGLMAISWDWTVVKTMLATTAYVCLAIALSGFTLFTYTKIDFIDKEDNRILGQIFIGICLLIIGSQLSFYFISNGALP